MFLITPDEICEVLKVLVVLFFSRPDNTVSYGARSKAVVLRVKRWKAPDEEKIKMSVISKGLC